MKRRKSFLNSIKDVNEQTDKSGEDYKRFLIVKEIMLRYFEISDMDRGTIHTQVFTMLYLSKKHYTYKVICETLHISKNTLVRYVDKYDELAAKILRQLDKERFERDF